MKKITILILALTYCLSGYSQTATTNAATNVGVTTVTLNASVDAQGTGTYEVYFRIRKSDNTPVGYQYVQDVDGTGSTPITFDYSGLTASTAYKYRVEIDGPDLVVGSYQNFSTSAATSPTVSSGAEITSIVLGSAALDDNNVTSNNGSAISAYGICWHTSTGPTISNSKHQVGTNGTPPINYNGSLTSLTNNTTYYVRAYATNGVGTNYGDELVFKSKCGAPTAENPTNVEGTTFTVNWSAPAGGSAIDKYYLDIATNSEFSSFPSLSGITYNNYDVGLVLTKDITGALANTTYYYRVRAYNDGGTDGESGSQSTSSNSKSVSTFSAEPTTQATNLTWGSFVSQGKMEFSWTNGNGSGRLLLMAAGAAITDPADGTEYVSNPAFGQGSHVGGGTYVVYKGTGGSKDGAVQVSGLSTGVLYEFKVVEYNGTGTSTNYNVTGVDGNGGSMSESGLPVELLSFTAQAVDGKVTVNWSTATEINNDYFTVERSSNMISWVVLQQTPGAGNSNALKQYSFVDNEPLQGIAYYRLKQTDYNGEFTYSLPVSVSSGNNLNTGNVLVADGNINTVVYNLNSKAVVAEIYTVTGQRLLRREFIPEGDVCQVTIPFSGFTHGLYLLKLNTGKEQTVYKFLY